MEGQKSGFSNVSPVLIVGIFTVIAPFVITAFGGNPSGWWYPIGVIIILIGAGMTIFK